MNIIIREARLKNIFVRVGDLVSRPGSDYPDSVAVVLELSEPSREGTSTWATLYWTRPGLCGTTEVPVHWLTHLVPEEMR
jgi:hypothetical protein